MPVGSGNDRFARTENIGQCPRGNLALLKIRGQIDIGRPDKLLQLFQLQKAVVENNMLLHPTILCQSLQAQSITFPLLGQQMRMRHP